MKVKIKSITPNSLNGDTAIVSFDDMPANAVLTAVILPGLWLHNNNAKVGGYISGEFYDFGPGKSANLTYSPPLDDAHKEKMVSLLEQRIKVFKKLFPEPLDNLVVIDRSVWDTINPDFETCSEDPSVVIGSFDWKLIESQYGKNPWCRVLDGISKNLNDSLHKHKETACAPIESDAGHINRVTINDVKAGDSISNLNLLPGECISLGTTNVTYKWDKTDVESESDADRIARVTRSMCK